MAQNVPWTSSIDQIYKALDQGRYDVVQTICARPEMEKWALAKALLAYSYASQRKFDKALEIACALLQAKPIDEAIVNALGCTFKLCRRDNYFAECYENAIYGPNHADLPEHFWGELFSCYVRMKEFKKMQQLASKGYKTFQNSKYLFWSVGAMLLQKDLPSTMYIVAERTMKKIYHELNKNKVPGAEELELYVVSLVYQQKFAEAISEVHLIAGRQEGYQIKLLDDDIDFKENTNMVAKKSEEIAYLLLDLHLRLPANTILLPSAGSTAAATKGIENREILWKSCQALLKQENNPDQWKLWCLFNNLLFYQLTSSTSTTTSASSGNENCNTAILEQLLDKQELSNFSGLIFFDANPLLQQATTPATAAASTASTATTTIPTIDWNFTIIQEHLHYIHQKQAQFPKLRGPFLAELRFIVTLYQYINNNTIALTKLVDVIEASLSKDHASVWSTWIHSTLPEIYSIISTQPAATAAEASEGGNELNNRYITLFSYLLIQYTMKFQQKYCCFLDMKPSFYQLFAIKTKQATKVMKIANTVCDIIIAWTSQQMFSQKDDIFRLEEREREAKEEEQKKQQQLLQEKVKEASSEGIASSLVNELVDQTTAAATTADAASTATASKMANQITATIQESMGEMTQEIVNNLATSILASAVEEMTTAATAADAAASGGDEKQEALLSPAVPPTISSDIPAAVPATADEEEEGGGGEGDEEDDDEEDEEGEAGEGKASGSNSNNKGNNSKKKPKKKRNNKKKKGGGNNKKGSKKPAPETATAAATTAAIATADTTTITIADDNEKEAKMMKEIHVSEIAQVLNKQEDMLTKICIFGQLLEINTYCRLQQLASIQSWSPVALAPDVVSTGCVSNEQELAIKKEKEEKQEKKLAYQYNFFSSLLTFLFTFFKASNDQFLEGVGGEKRTIKPGDSSLLVFSSICRSYLLQTLLPPTLPAHSTLVKTPVMAPGIRDQASYLFLLQWCALLTYAVETSPYTHSLKIDLIEAYRMLGNTMEAYKLYEKLGMKYIQHDSLCYLIVPALWETGMIREVTHVYRTIIHFHHMSRRESIEQMSRAFDYGNYCKSLEINNFLTMTSQSMSLALAYTEMASIELMTTIFTGEDIYKFFAESPVPQPEDFFKVQENIQEKALYHHSDFSLIDRLETIPASSSSIGSLKQQTQSESDQKKEGVEQEVEKEEGAGVNMDETSLRKQELEARIIQSQQIVHGYRRLMIPNLAISNTAEAATTTKAITNTADEAAATSKQEQEEAEKTIKATATTTKTATKQTKKTVVAADRFSQSLDISSEFAELQMKNFDHMLTLATFLVEYTQLSHETVAATTRKDTDDLASFHILYKVAEQDIQMISQQLLSKESLQDYVIKSINSTNNYHHILSPYFMKKLWSFVRLAGTNTTLVFQYILYRIQRIVKFGKKKIETTTTTSAATAADAITAASTAASTADTTGAAIINSSDTVATTEVTAAAVSTATATAAAAITATTPSLAVMVINPQFVQEVLSSLLHFANTWSTLLNELIQLISSYQQTYFNVSAVDGLILHAMEQPFLAIPRPPSLASSATAAATAATAADEGAGEKAEQQNNNLLVMYCKPYVEKISKSTLDYQGESLEKAKTLLARRHEHCSECISELVKFMHTLTQTHQNIAAIVSPRSPPATTATTTTGTVVQITNLLIDGGAKVQAVEDKK